MVCCDSGTLTSVPYLYFKAPSYPPTSNLSFYMRTKRVLAPPKPPSPSRCSSSPTQSSYGNLETLQTASRALFSPRSLRTAVFQLSRTRIPTVTSWESGAVINYLLRVYDKQNILKANPASEQAHVDYDKWTFFLVSTLGPMQGQVNWFSGHPTKNNDARSQGTESRLYAHMVSWRGS